MFFTKLNLSAGSGSYDVHIPKTLRVRRWLWYPPRPVDLRSHRRHNRRARSSELLARQVYIFLGLRKNILPMIADRLQPFQCVGCRATFFGEVHGLLYRLTWREYTFWTTCGRSRVRRHNAGQSVIPLAFALEIGVIQGAQRFLLIRYQVGRFSDFPDTLDQ